MAFKFNNKLNIEIENNKFVIDISSEKVIEAVKLITEKSIEAVKKGSSTEEDTVAYIAYVKSFISDTLGEDAFEQIFEGMTISVEDLYELSYYILDEIGKFKNNRMSKYSKVIAPEKLKS